MNRERGSYVVVEVPDRGTVQGQRVTEETHGSAHGHRDIVEHKGTGWGDVGGVRDETKVRSRGSSDRKGV